MESVSITFLMAINQCNVTEICVCKGLSDSDKLIKCTSKQNGKAADTKMMPT